MIVDEIAQEQLPLGINNNILNMHNIEPLDDKAKVIVDALIDFDLRNNK